MAPKIYLMVALGMALQLVTGAQLPTNNKAICTSPQCVLTAAAILRDMSPQADPCQDFSQYACGGFLEREEIPADQDSVGYFHIIRDQNNLVVRSILTADINTLIAEQSDNVSQEELESSRRNIKKIQDLYTSCMDEEQIAKVGRQPVVDEVQELLKIFPVSDSVIATPTAATTTPSSSKSSKSSAARLVSSTTIDNKENLSKTLAYLNKLGVDVFSSFDVSPDVKEPTANVLELTEGGLGLPSKEYYLDNRIVGIYETTVGKMFNLILGSTATETTTTTTTTEKDAPVLEKWKIVAKDVVGFEKELAAISTDVNILRDSEKTYNPSNLKEISAMTPSINWTTVLQNTLPSNMNIPSLIIVSSPEFQQKLEVLLQKTSPQTIQNYLVWSVIRQLSGNLALEWRQPLREVNAVLSGVSASVIPDRWKYCVSIVNRQLGDIAGHFFIQKQFKGESQNQVHDMIETLRETYIKAFPKLDWLDKETAKGAIEKMKAIVQLTGFSTESPNVGSPKSLEEYYEKYKVEAKDFFGNQKRVNLWSAEKTLKELEEPVNKAKMHMVPQTVNAYYSPTENQIVFPAGILQAPFFHTENPEYVNYGGIGVVAGHEVTHGFDDKGHLFDSQGRMDN
ncbi:hypothetical protein BGZ46_007369, partial [Entomortierella lignicola]